MVVVYLFFMSWRVGSSSALDPEGIYGWVVKGSHVCFVQWDEGSIQCRESASGFLCRVLGWGAGQLDEKWVVVSVFYAHVAQLAEHVLGKDEVSGSIPLVGSTWRRHAERGYAAVLWRGLRANRWNRTRAGVAESEVGLLPLRASIRHVGCRNVRRGIFLLFVKVNGCS